ncbi:MAG: D-alanyl-D-alanine carboxypeptidase, partial [Butyricicoccus sp.]|nr:D-alanyl-D-alanine carboxypeptidase [Butyricicoccus sp.]
KRLSCLFLSLMLCLGCAGALGAEELVSEYALVMCAETGEVLYEKNGSAPARPASITKLLTALIAFENVDDFSQTTTVTETALDVEYDSTRIGLIEGEEVTLEDMMAAMLIGSANDASNVLAEAVGGSLENFTQMMNDKLVELGCTGSHFVNAHGLDDDNQYASAYDMALITRALLDHPEFTELCGTMMYVMPANDISGEERYFNCRQTMLMSDEEDYYEGAFAGKNGYTSKALQTQVLCAYRDDMTLISVIMSCPSKAEKVEDTKKLLDYGFENFTVTTVDASTLSNLIEDAGFDPTGVDIADMTVNIPKNADPSALSISAERNEDGSLSLICKGETVALASLPYTDPAEEDPETEPATSADAVPTVGEEKSGFNFGAFAALFSRFDLSALTGNVKVLVIAAVAVLAVILLIAAIFSARASRVRRRREELSEMLRSASARRDDEFERLMELHENYGREDDLLDDENI